jgi:hypothetical protein
MTETAAPGLHDAILLCAGIAAVYLVVAVMQLMQLKRRTPVLLAAKEPSVSSHLPMNNDVRASHDASFSSQLRQSNIEAELKRELKRLGAEVDRLHEVFQAESQAIRTEVQAELQQLRLLRTERKNVSNVMPFYNEAMDFARGGLSAAGIAVRCGISLGEAELVAALAHNPNDHSAVESLPQHQTASERNDERNQRYHSRQRAAA